MAALLHDLRGRHQPFIKVYPFYKVDASNDIECRRWQPYGGSAQQLGHRHLTINMTHASLHFGRKNDEQDAEAISAQHEATCDIFASGHSMENRLPGMISMYRGRICCCGGG